MDPKEAAGNWKKFEHFTWHDKPVDPDNWFIYHYVHRDSGLLGQSNARVIERRMAPYTQGFPHGDEDNPDAKFEHFRHWAVGWIDAVAVRVFALGHTTPAWDALNEMLVSLENYPILDEEDYCQSEYDAAIAGILDAAHYLEDEITEEDAYKIFDWLWDHEQEELENIDDQGAYPSLESVQRAWEAIC